jgi:hypothetical protein
MKSKVAAVQSRARMTENLAGRCQLSGRSTAFRARFGTLSIGLMILLLIIIIITIAGCGAAGGFNPNNVTVTLAPEAATVAANGQVTLQTTVTGLCSTCSTASIFWSITENGDASCGWVDTPPAGPCPAGTIQLTGADPGNSQTATYYVPSTAGSYHVVADALIAFGSPTKEATSVVTVTTVAP